MKRKDIELGYYDGIACWQGRNALAVDRYKESFEVGDVRHDLLNRWQSAISDLFPGDANFEFVREDFTNRMRISWPLHDTPDRPNKASRQIVLVFSEEAVDDYDGAIDDDKARADKRLRDFVGFKLRAFEPGHNEPRGLEPPSVFWGVATGWLNGRATPVWE